MNNCKLDLNPNWIHILKNLWPTYLVDWTEIYYSMLSSKSVKFCKKKKNPWEWQIWIKFARAPKKHCHRPQTRKQSTRDLCLRLDETFGVWFFFHTPLLYPFHKTIQLFDRKSYIWYVLVAERIWKKMRRRKWKGWEIQVRFEHTTWNWKTIYKSWSYHLHYARLK